MMTMFEAAIVCLAMNIYHEARDQPRAGQIAVGQVVMHRVYDDRFPDNVCDVVKQGPTYSWTEDFPVRNRCQFSWYCDGKSDEPKDTKAWDNAMLMAIGVYNGRVVDLVDGATHYHATYVQPEWAETKTETVRIADHIFYRWDY
jgi:N-acetylmuramoyl-L-alanine amidase